MLQLKFQNDLSYQEISEITKLSVSNVGVLIHNALENSAATLRAGLQGFPAVHTSNCLMKINLDDPNLTAFALGELSGDGTREDGRSGRRLRRKPRSFVAETQQLSRLLASGI